MDEYIKKEALIKAMQEDYNIRMQEMYKEEIFQGYYSKVYCDGIDAEFKSVIRIIENMKAADVQEKRYCRMIPLEPDCRGCTNVFICTNCHQHIHLGFIRKEYSGSFCLECGAEVKDGDTSE